MSHTHVPARALTVCFPRVSGDEPGMMVEAPKPGAFSPRERG